MNMNEAIQGTQQSLSRIISSAQGLSIDRLHWKPAEDKWSVMEVLVHVDEAIPYWLNEITRLLAAPGTAWGRGLQDEQRLAALAEAGSRSLAEVLDSIANAKERVAVVLGPITQDELQQQSPSRNPRFGTQPLSFVIQHLVVDHAAVHDKQITRNLTQYDARQA